MCNVWCSHELLSAFINRRRLNAFTVHHDRRWLAARKHATLRQTVNVSGNGEKQTIALGGRERIWEVPWR